MFGRLKMIFEAIQAGKSLRKIETWKKVQMTSSIIAGLLLSVATFFPSLMITPEQVNVISLAIANIGGTAVGDISLTKQGIEEIITGISTFIIVVLVPYWTVATTEKVGLPPLSDADNSKKGPTAKIPGH